MGFAAWFSGKALQERLQVAEKALAEANAILGAITESVAGIIFTPSGEILEANPLFLSVVGYRKEEVVGKHHRMFCSEDYARSAEYRQFWERLQAGKPHSGRFPRRNAKGALIWLEATYFPVKGADGRVAKVIKIATDVTEQHERLRAQSAVFEALNRSMVVIEFSPDGHVLAANDNFLETMGYRLEDIRGKHHRMFCHDSFYREQPDFWTRLQGGKFLTGKFERVRADGQNVWLEATYNPILDEQGKTVKVIKFASEITNRVQRAAKIREAAQLAATTAEQTSKIAQDGSLVLRASLDLYGRMKTRTEDARQAITQLNDQSRSIETIVAT
ncbi:MAG: PAS domain-containing methyl-accepting chemotaxis protein, partial [Gammaproteobacteria bacterium]|nr:PAS domain-containing methyl-accepting chemotaxis protein [Gammaproteobacteria bacterium]